MKKTRSIIGILLVVMLAMPLVMASGFSPSSITLELESNEQACQKITVESTSETIAVSDFWAENKDIEWKVSLFDKTASSHGISINYEKELSGLDEREVEVCLSGSKVGEYHGVVLLKEEQEGNSIVQMGVWLKVKITEPEQAVSTPSSSGGGSSGGGGSGSATTTTNTANTSTQTVTSQQQTPAEATTSAVEEETVKETTPAETPMGITGSIVNELSQPKAIGVGVGIVLVCALVFYSRKRIKQKNTLNSVSVTEK